MLIYSEKNPSLIKNRIMVSFIKKHQKQILKTVSRATILPLRICNKTLKLSMTWSLQVRSLNTKLCSYPRTLNKPCPNWLTRVT